MYLSIEQRVRTRPYTDLPAHRVETLLEKGSGLINEDVLLQDGNIFGVFDGATSISTTDLPTGLTGGLIAAQIAAETFRQGGDDLLCCAEEANRRISRALCPENISHDKRYRLWSTSAAVIRLAGDHFEYCQTGDSLVLVIRKDGSFSNLSPEINHDRETLRQWKDAQVPNGVTIHEALKEQIRNVRMEMNVTYGVLNGEPEAMDFIRHGRRSLNGIAAILVFTDGLFLPREDPDREIDWPAFVALYRHGGIKAIHEYVRSKHCQDPDCRKYPRFKTHDDAAAIAITL
jgi:Protein phosphatase 2C